MKLKLYQKPNKKYYESIPKSKEYPRHWKTTIDLEITLSDNSVIFIPKGYIWDGASIPKWLWWLFYKVELFAICFLIHDFLYVDKENQLKKFNYNIFKTRKFADDEMRLWAENHHYHIKRTILVFYIVIRKAGGLFYSRQLQIPS